MSHPSTTTTAQAFHLQRFSSDDSTHRVYCFGSILRSLHSTPLLRLLSEREYRVICTCQMCRW